MTATKVKAQANVKSKPKKSVKHKKDCYTLTEDQRRDLIRNIKSMKIRILVKLMLSCALRVSEAVNLLIEHVDPALTIRITNYEKTKLVREYRTKTESSDRILPISEDLYNEIKLLIGKRKTGYIFQSNKSPNGMKTKYHVRTDTVIKAINRAANQCESIPLRYDIRGNLTKNIGSHICRRTAATHLMAENTPLNEISPFLGHSSPRTTWEYVKTIDTQNYEKYRTIMKKMKLETDTNEKTE